MMHIIVKLPAHMMRSVSSCVDTAVSFRSFLNSVNAQPTRHDEKTSEILNPSSYDIKCVTGHWHPN